MQIVSQEYKDSMKSPLRERAYIKLSFGAEDKQAREDLMIDYSSSSYTGYGNLRNESTDTRKTYATLEQNFTTVDGSMFFPPREDIIGPWNDISECDVGGKLVSESPWSMHMKFFQDKSLVIHGITLDFGDNYPTELSIKSDTVEFKNIKNDKSVLVLNEDLGLTKNITITVTKMKNEHSRVRIYSAFLGYNLRLDNKDVISSKMETYISPILETLPQIDFSVTISDEEGRFNPDNPKSISNLMSKGNKMNVKYGYQLPNSNEIEWIKGGELYCSDWDSRDKSATIRCTDIFRTLDKTYTYGIYDDTSFNTFYNEFEKIFLHAGIEDYQIDEIFTIMHFENPIPLVPMREALQLLANAGDADVFQDRNGKVIVTPHSDTNVSDFKIDTMDMMTKPVLEREELVKEIIIPTYEYVLSGKVETLVDEEIVLERETNVEYTFPATAFYEIRMDGHIYTPIEYPIESSFYLSFLYMQPGTHHIQITGEKYNIIKQINTFQVGNRTEGRTITWDNPLIDRLEFVEPLAQRLINYYLTEGNYKYDTRGNPELDTNDIITQFNEYRDNMNVRVVEQELNFKQSFSGKITTRRIGGQNVVTT